MDPNSSQEVTTATCTWGTSPRAWMRGACVPSSSHVGRLPNAASYMTGAQDSIAATALCAWLMSTGLRMLWGGWTASR